MALLPAVLGPRARLFEVLDSDDRASDERARLQLEAASEALPLALAVAAANFSGSTGSDPEANNASATGTGSDSDSDSDTGTRSDSASAIASDCDCASNWEAFERSLPVAAVAPPSLPTRGSSIISNFNMPSGYPPARRPMASASSGSSEVSTATRQRPGGFEGPSPGSPPP